MRWIANLTLASLILCVSACHRTEPLTSKEQTTVTEFTAHLKPRCVGRFLINMPDDAMTSGRTDINGVTVETQTMTEEEHRQSMIARSAELRAAKSMFGYKFLYAEQAIDGIKSSQYFVSLGNPNALTDTERVIEAYKWDRGHQIKLRMEASDARNSVSFKDDPTVRNAPYMTDVSERAQTVVSMLSRIRGRADDDIPTEPGVCFIGGFLPGWATDKEKISAGFILKDMHDAGFRLETNSSITEPTTLLQRKSDIDKMINGAEGKTLRNGVADLPGMQAEEWLTEGITEARVRGHYFMLEANSKLGSAKTPVVRLDMDNGARLPGIDGDRKVTHASLTEGEAIALWDAVSRSLRPRPNGF